MFFFHFQQQVFVESQSLDVCSNVVDLQQRLTNLTVQMNDSLSFVNNSFPEINILNQRLSNILTETETFIVSINIIVLNNYFISSIMIN